MERRNWSLKALKDFSYIDSLDEDNLKAKLIQSWVENHLSKDFSITDFDLEVEELKLLSELFYKNIKFMKDYKKELKKQLDSHHKIKKFLK